MTPEENALFQKAVDDLDRISEALQRISRDVKELNEEIDYLRGLATPTKKRKKGF